MYLCSEIMNRKVLFIILALVAVSLLVIFGVHGCQRRADRMRAVLDSALEQNRNYIPFTSDSALLEVVDYYDRYGTPNDRLRAHYALGCVYRDLHDAPIALLTWERGIAAADTTASDCDFATLFRVYGQMADIYFRQYMPEKQLEAENAFSHYALCAGDTLNYIRGLLLRDDAFLALGDTAAIYRNIEHVRHLYLERGLKAEAAEVYPMPIRLALESQEFERADSMMHIFETQSSLFDEQGNIAPTHELYYYYKGIYYLGVHQLDSSELWFRKTMSHESIRIDAYRGLLSLYQHQHNSDSIYKYARLYEDALARYMKRTHIQSIELSESMYDYSRQQQMAQAQERKANSFKLALIAFLTIGFVVALRVRWIAKKRKEEKKHLLNTYHLALDELDKIKREAEILRIATSTNKETAQLFREKVEQIDELETLVDQMKKQIGETESITIKQKLEDTEIVKNFHSMADYHNGNTPRTATAKEWGTLMETIRSCHPTFYFFLQSHKLSDLKQKVCILSYLGFDNTAIETLTNANKGSISNARKSLAQELFHLTSARELNGYLRGI